MSIEGLQKAIDLCGTQAELGRRIGKGQAHISLWLTRDKKVPADIVLTIEKRVGIPRHELRPDLYPPEEYELLSEAIRKKAA